MVTVAAGDRLVLRTPAGSRLAVRALHATELVGPWQVRVLAPAGRVAAVAGVLELAGPAGGTVRLPARLAIADGALVLEAGHADEPTGTFTPLEGQQRRDDVRGEVHLPVRVAALDGRAEQALRGCVLTGHTLDVSAGGARVALHGASRVPAPGARLYVEVELPDGELAPAVVAVVAGDGGEEAGMAAVHVRFVDLAPLDRERLVGLVFEAERRLLAQRPRPWPARPAP
jgi:PilZ domain